MLEHKSSAQSATNPYAPPELSSAEITPRPAARTTGCFIVAVIISFFLLAASLFTADPLPWLLLMLVNLAGMRTWAWSRWAAAHARPLNRGQWWQLAGTSLGVVTAMILGGLAIFLLTFVCLRPYGLSLQLPDGSLAPATDTLAVAVFVVVVWMLNRSWPPHHEPPARTNS